VLFDLRSGKRRRLVQVVYSLLAVSFLIGFVIFGVGNSGIGSLSDLFGGGSGGSASSAFDAQIAHAQAVLKKDPKNQQALANLANYEFQAGRSGVTQSSPTAAPTISGDAQTDFSTAVDAWTRYLKVAKKPDPGIANEMAQAYVYLNDANGASRAQRVLAEAQPSTSTLGNLATYLYFAGNFKAGDKAAKQALAKTPKSQVKQVKTQLAQIASQARKAAKAQKAAAKASGSSGSGVQNPFGGVAPGGTPTTP
jgi:tetratricopeptide (TPR) repeat protein